MKINLPKMQKSLVKFFAFTLTLFILFSSNVAIASQIPTPFPLKIDISGGTLEMPFVIRILDVNEQPIIEVIDYDVSEAVEDGYEIGLIPFYEEDNNQR